MIASGSPERAKRPKRCSHRNRQWAGHSFRRSRPPTNRRENRVCWQSRRQPRSVSEQDQDAGQSRAADDVREIPRLQFARIRTWMNYGMTVAQVADLYGAAVGEIERILRGSSWTGCFGLPAASQAERYISLPRRAPPGAAADRAEQRPPGIVAQPGAVEIGGEIFIKVVVARASRAPLPPFFAQPHPDSRRFCVYKSSTAMPSAEPGIGAKE